MISDEESISILQNDDQITIKKEKNNANESISAYSRSNLYNNSYSQKDLTVSQYYSIDESYNDSIVESKEDDTKVKQLSPIKRKKESHQSVISIPPLLQEEVIQESTPISENKSEACETEEPVETNERKTNHIVFDDEKYYTIGARTPYLTGIKEAVKKITGMECEFRFVLNESGVRNQYITEEQLQSVFQGVEIEEE